MILILPISLLLTILYLYLKTFNREDSFFSAIIVWNCFLFAVTELLSLFYLITPIFLSAIWVIYCILLIYLIYKHTKLSKISIEEIVLSYFAKIKKLFTCDLSGVLISICLALVIIMLFIAVITPPYNWDSLTYHLSRVMNWMQNKSVNYYPSCIKRCLYCSTQAEYTVLHTFELSNNSECFANTVQWAGYVLNGFGIYFLCSKFSFSRANKTLAVFLTMTLPMAIAQSCTTQTDMLGAMWLIIFMWYLLELDANTKLDFRNKSQLTTLVKCALAVGMGYTTKGTVCFVMIGLLLYLLISRLLKNDTLSNLLVFLVVAGVTILPLFLPKFIRDKLYFGNGLSNETYADDLIGTLNPAKVIVNIYKNYGHVAVRPHISKFIGKVGIKLAELLQVDINEHSIALSCDYPNDISTSFGMDYAPNSVVFLTFIIAFILLILFFKKYNPNKWFIFACALSQSIITIGARYTEWNNRYMIPALYLMVLTIIFVLENAPITPFIKHLWIYFIILFAFIDTYGCVEEQCKAVYDLTWMDSRTSVYFRARSNEECYNEIYDIVRNNGYKTIGLLLAEDTFEYPIWRALKTNETTIVHCTDIIPNNAQPSCIIAIDQQDDYVIGDKIDFHGNAYSCIWNYNDGQYAVFEMQ